MQQKSIETQRASFLPPWIWCWLLFSLVISFSNINIRHSLLDLLFGTYDANPAASEGLTHFPFLFRILDILDLWPPILLAAGLFTILMPQPRARHLEKSYRLQMPNDTLPTAIVDFIHQYASDLQIKVNLRRYDNIAFIYPLSYRRSAIAIFAPLVLLWHKNRPDAEAILLHEIAHQQHGDTLIAGEGSYLEKTLDWWLPLFLLTGLIPMLILWADQSITFVQSSLQSGWSLAPLLSHEANSLLTLFIPGWLLILLEDFLQTASIFLLPLIGFWCIEYNADQYVLSIGNYSESLLRTLSRTRSSQSRWQWLLAHMTHPPAKLRQWLAQSSLKSIGIYLLLLSFPLSAFFLLLDVPQNIYTDYLHDQYYYGHTDILQRLATETGSVLLTIAAFWAIATLILLCWPLVSSYWTQLFHRKNSYQPHHREKKAWERHRVYVLCACITAALSLWGYALYWLTR